MKRFALLSTVIAIVAIALFSTSAAQGLEVDGDHECDKPAIGVMYETWDEEPEGILRVANSDGDFVEVFAANGEMVWAGHIPEEYFEVPCPNHGADDEGTLLHVCSTTGVSLSIDKDSDWIWE